MPGLYSSAKSVICVSFFAFYSEIKKKLSVKKICPTIENVIIPAQ